MSSVIQTPALILRHSDDREHDRRIMVLTPAHGQLEVRARGTKKALSKLAGSLEPMTEVDLQLASGRVFDVVTGSVVRERWPGLRQDIVRCVAGQWSLELLERVTRPNHDSQAVYELARQGLRDLADPILTPGQVWLRLCRWAWILLEHEGFAALNRATVSPAVQDFVSTGAWPSAARPVFAELHRLVEQAIHLTLDQPLQCEGVLQRVMRLEQLSSRLKSGRLNES